MTPRKSMRTKSIKKVLLDGNPTVKINRKSGRLNKNSSECINEIIRSKNKSTLEKLNIVPERISKINLRSVNNNNSNDELNAKSKMLKKSEEILYHTKNKQKRNCREEKNDELLENCLKNVKTRSKKVPNGVITTAHQKLRSRNVKPTLKEKVSKVKNIIKEQKSPPQTRTGNKNKSNEESLLEVKITTSTPKQNTKLSQKIPKRLQLKNKLKVVANNSEENSTTVDVQNVQKFSDPPTSAPKLRTRKKVKYEESSLELSQLEKPSEIKKVPIYKQPIKEKKSTKRKGDQYEFDSDSEKYKKRKKRNCNDSDEYNKTIQNILKNVIKKTKIKRQRAIFTDKKQISKDNKVVIFKDDKTNNHVLKKQVPQDEKMPEKVLTRNKPEEDLIFKEDKTNNNVLKKQVPQEEKMPEKDKEIDVLTRNENERNEPEEDLNVSHSDDDNMENEVPDNDLDNLFGFTETCKPKSPKKIHIINDIHIEPNKEWRLSIGSPTFFNNARPNANSTMLSNVLTPWRFNDINIKRNPHFITLKDSSLPCINQELVLDHHMVDKLESTFNSTHDNLQLKKMPLQKPITDYLSGNTENKENSQISLFDCHQLSPIKSVRNIKNKDTPIKRRILCEKNENNFESQPASTPVRLDKPDENFTNFGFDSFDDLDTAKEVVKGKDDKPFRLSFNVNDKKYKGKQRKNIEKIESPEVSDEEHDTSDVESEAAEVKLFEDFADTQDCLQISDIPVHRRKKSKKYDANKDSHKHKKRKDIRTKEEEEEAEKWAAAFNSMCEEIDQFPLEVE